MSNKNTLSDHPAVFFAQAIYDFHKCDSDDKYDIDFEKWWKVNYRGCTVCVAGAVIEKRLLDTEYAPEDYITVKENSESTLHVSYSRVVLKPSNFSDKLRDKLYAINYFRRGCMEVAYSEHLKKPFPKGLQNTYPVTRYDNFKFLFYLDIIYICEELGKYDPIPEDEIEEFESCLLKVKQWIKKENTVVRELEDG